MSVYLNYSPPTRRPPPSEEETETTSPFKETVLIRKESRGILQEAREERKTIFERAAQAFSQFTMGEEEKATTSSLKETVLSRKGSRGIPQEAREERKTIFGRVAQAFSQFTMGEEEKATTSPLKETVLSREESRRILQKAQEEKKINSEKAAPTSTQFAIVEEKKVPTSPLKEEVPSKEELSKILQEAQEEMGTDFKATLPAFSQLASVEEKPLSEEELIRILQETFDQMGIDSETAAPIFTKPPNQGLQERLMEVVQELATGPLNQDRRNKLMESFDRMSKDCKEHPEKVEAQVICNTILTFTMTGYSCFYDKVEARFKFLDVNPTKLTINDKVAIMGAGMAIKDMNINVVETVCKRLVSEDKAQYLTLVPRFQDESVINYILTGLGIESEEAKKMAACKDVVIALLSMDIFILNENKDLIENYVDTYNPENVPGGFIVRLPPEKATLIKGQCRDYLKKRLGLY